MNEQFATLIIDGAEVKLPIVIGTRGEKAIDITSLRKTTGYVTLDPSLANTAECKSAISFVDGENGVLLYRGYPIEDLVNIADFVKVAYLLINGELPTPEQDKNFRENLNENSMLHEGIRHFFDRFPLTSKPMTMLSTMFNAQSSFYENVDLLSLTERIEKTAARVISSTRTMAAFTYRKINGLPVNQPRHDLTFCANFLHMMFDSPVKPYIVEPEAERILNILFILHAEHSSNCSCHTVTTIGSAQANLYAALSAGISALSGPLHGGANEAVCQMLRDIQNKYNGNVRAFLDQVKLKKEKAFGFGHRVYKTYDPRAMIIKKETHQFLEAMNLNDPFLDLAQELEEIALHEDYFLERNLYPNVDFYSGVIYRALGIPESFFTMMFALARLPGWIAHWTAMRDVNTKICRPREIYTGLDVRHCNR